MAGKYEVWMAGMTGKEIKKVENLDHSERDEWSLTSFPGVTEEIVIKFADTTVNVGTIHDCKITKGYDLVKLFIEMSTSYGDGIDQQGCCDAYVSMLESVGIVDDLKHKITAGVAWKVSETHPALYDRKAFFELAREHPLLKFVLQHFND